MKRIISIIMAVVMMMSVAVVGTSSVSAKNTLKVVCTQSKYKGHKISLTKTQRKHIEILCYNEGGSDYNSSALFAQCMRDAVYDGLCTASNIKKAMGYSASDTKINGGLKSVPDYCKKAVKAIFDNGDYVVKHHLLYMYAPALCKSSWHESLHFVVQYNGIRFFDVKGAK